LLTRELIARFEAHFAGAEPIAATFEPRYVRVPGKVTRSQRTQLEADFDAVLAKRGWGKGPS
jgi:hypothetical protein